MRSVLRIIFAVALVCAVGFCLLIAIPHIKCIGMSKRRDRMQTAYHIDTLATALALFRDNNGRYPSAQEGLDVLIEDRLSGPYITDKKCLFDSWGTRIEYLLTEGTPYLKSVRAGIVKSVEGNSRRDLEPTATNSLTRSAAR